jgi:hypothetical protein
MILWLEAWLLLTPILFLLTLTLSAYSDTLSAYPFFLLSQLERMHGYTASSASVVYSLIFCNSVQSI